jgi:hypothetical protein
MRRIAAPMVDGMMTAPLLSIFVIPAVFLLMRRHKLAPAGARSLRDSRWAGGEPHLSDPTV